VLETTAPLTAVKEALAEASEDDLRRITPRVERGPWSLHEDALAFLASLVHRVRPRHVVESGSGVSTRVLAWACAEAVPGARITLVDNDPASTAATAEALAHQDVKYQVALQTAPLALRDCGGEVAVAEFERAHANGAAFAVIAWPAFWWLEHYGALARHLETRYARCFSDPALVVYDLWR